MKAAYSRISFFGAAFLTILVGLPHVQAQDRAEIAIVPNAPHSNEVAAVAFSPDGARVLSGSHDKFLKLWDAASGQLLRNFEHPGGVGSVVWSPNGRWILSGSSDAILRMWDAASGNLLRTFIGHTQSVTSVAFSRDGMRILSGGRDRMLILWDAQSGKAIWSVSMGRPNDWISSVALSRDGSRAFSAADNTVRVWDTASGSLIRSWQGQAGYIRGIAVSPDGKYVLSGSRTNVSASGTSELNEKTVALWDADSGQLVRTFEGHPSGSSSVAFSPDGAFVVSAGGETLKVWDSATSLLAHTINTQTESVSSVAFSPDGSRLLSGSREKTVKLWDIQSERLIQTMAVASDWITSVAPSPDGTRLLSGSEDGALKLWDLASGRLIRVVNGHLSGVTSVAFSPDGTRLLSGAGSLFRLLVGSGTHPSEDYTLKLWDVSDGHLVQTYKGHARTVAAIAFSPSGNRLLSGSADKSIKLWDSATGQLLRTFEGHSNAVSSVTFSPDGTQILSGSWDRSMKLWDASTGELIHTFVGHSGYVDVVAYSPDGSYLLSGSFDRTVRLWDPRTRQLIRQFEGHSGIVTSAAFSPEGRRVLSGSYDNTLKLWDASSGELIRTISGHADVVRSVSFSSDGTRLFSGSWDGTVRIWNAFNGQLLASLFASRENEWLAIAPTGFFAGSSQLQMLNIVRGLELTKIQQVHQSLFNPDLLREALAGDPSGEVEVASKVINLSKVLDSGPAPDIKITSAPTESARDIVKLVINVTDRGAGVGRIEGRLNGVTVAVANKVSGKGPNYPIAHEIALDTGNNAIDFVAYNKTNLLASLPARTTIKFTGSIDSPKPKLHILAIGINSYIDKGWTPPGKNGPLRFAPLGLAVKDAKAFANDFKRAATDLYEEVRVTTVLDRDASQANLGSVIKKFSQDVHARDTVILFAAAHGISVDGRFYLIPQDYQGGPDPKALAKKAIDQERLQEWLVNVIRAKKVLVLLDTCESGALIAGHRRSRADRSISEAATGRLHEATGRPILTAAALGQFAREGLIARTGVQHGLFTYALLDGLRNADINRSGTIELSELVAHVQTLVPKLAAELGGIGRTAIAVAGSTIDRQTARFGSHGEDFVLTKQLTDDPSSTPKARSVTPAANAAPTRPQTKELKSGFGLERY